MRLQEGRSIHREEGRVSRLHLHRQIQELGFRTSRKAMILLQRTEHRIQGSPRAEGFLRIWNTMCLYLERIRI
ncbi:hypothetical protein GOP47_0018957 [Adiantum capillus-veneris]|uniref:Uncharacterized protein n=1 Tax=Adiantum capillus-veneris TaxID=13818 RepID=A0A9D4UF46_ADICA|nr:hypothetical protein GOP47_0018957 [Adiantum capillus-veneris]